MTYQPDGKASGYAKDMKMFSLDQIITDIRTEIDTRERVFGLAAAYNVNKHLLAAYAALQKAETAEMEHAQ